MHVKEEGCGRIGRIQMDQDRVQWQAFVKTVMNLRVSLKMAEFS